MDVFIRPGFIFLVACFVTYPVRKITVVLTLITLKKGHQCKSDLF